MNWIIENMKPREVAPYDLWTPEGRADTASKI